MNTIMIIGRTTSEIEIKQTPNGKAVASFTLAVPKRFKRDEANFIPVVAWEKQAELLSQYVGKGQQIAIRGELASRKYEDKQGQKRTAYEVVAEEIFFCDTKNKSESANASAQTGYVPESLPDVEPNFEEIAEDEALPF